MAKEDDEAREHTSRFLKLCGRGIEQARRHQDHETVLRIALRATSVATRRALKFPTPGYITEAEEWRARVEALESVGKNDNRASKVLNWSEQRLAEARDIMQATAQGPE